MKPHPKIRKTIKWGGAAVTVLLVVMWIGSAWWYVEYSKPGFFVRVYKESAWFYVDRPAAFASCYPSVGWSINNWPNGVTRRREFKFRAGTPAWLVFPLWIPAALSFVASAYVWRLDLLAGRRERATRLNLCPKCNYDRAGLGGGAGAVCPECGDKPKVV